jgi:hypothetical protein
MASLTPSRVLNYNDNRIDDDRIEDNRIHDHVPQREITPEAVSAPIPPAALPPLLSTAHMPHSPLHKEPAKTRYVQPEPLDREKKRRRLLTSDHIDSVNINRNVILPLDGLLCFIENNFCCKRCHKSLKRSTRGEATPPLGLEVFGLACGLNFKCGCGEKQSLRPVVVPSATHKLTTLQDGHPFATRVNAGDFEINRRLHLGLQLCGGGRQDGNIIAGMLNLNVNPMKAKWTEAQEMIGNVIINVGEEVLEENLHIECLLSPVGDDGRSALDVASDTRWDKRGSSRKYNSLSGCSTAFGLRSELPIGIEVMSQVCIKCTKGIDHDPDICPKNYTGSAKGMEAAGAARIVCRLFANENDKCYIAHLVTDDDSSVRKILTHSYQELIDKLQATIDDWPRYANGAKKPDNGLLPILHAAIAFLADKGHRNRGYSRVIFAEAMKSKKDGCGCTKLDAERMKRRMSWTLRLHSHGTFPEFQRAVLAVLEHHFNNHEHCEAWCKAAHGTEEEIREQGLRFRCKVRNKKLYEFLKKHHEKFSEETKLRQLWHRYDTNLVEAFNKFLTKFLPKDKTYCQTIENKARSMVAVGIQSIGYQQFYSRVFERTGIGIFDNDITGLFLRKEDADKLWRKLRRRKESVKIERMRKLYRDLKEGVRKQVADNRKEMSYEAGMMGPDGEEQPQQQQQKRRRRKSTATCQYCGVVGHERTTSSQCLKNPKTLALAAEKAAEKAAGAVGK